MKLENGCRGNMEHLKATIEWLKRVQDSTGDGGVSGGILNLLDGINPTLRLQDTSYLLFLIMHIIPKILIATKELQKWVIIC